MSHLLLPRIHFAGVFVVNPGTGNNEDTMQPTLCKGGQVKVNIDSLAGYGANEANFRQYMESPGLLRGLWNYYGDNDCYFNRAKVTSVELRKSNQQRAECLCLPEQDSLIGAGVALNDALMVDVNSHSAKGPQIFADEFVIQKDALLCRGQPTTAYRSEE